MTTAAPHLYLIDDAFETTLADLIDANADDLDPAVVEAVAALAVGETYAADLGASGVCPIRRVA